VFLEEEGKEEGVGAGQGGGAMSQKVEGGVQETRGLS
jgi:hypothetical protein